MICKTCGQTIEGIERELLGHLVIVHSIEYRDAYESPRALVRLLETHYDQGDDGTAGVREPRRPNPPRPSVTAFADSDSK